MNNQIKYLLLVCLLLSHARTFADAPLHDFNNGRFANAIQGWQARQENHYQTRRALRIASAYLEMGLYREAEATLRAVKPAEHDEAETRVRWLIVQSRLLLTRDHAAYPEARRLSRQALAQRDAIKDPVLLAELLNHAGNLYSMGLDYPAAIAAHEEGLALLNGRAETRELSNRLHLNLSRAVVRQQLFLAPKPATRDDFQDSLEGLRQAAEQLRQGDNRYFRVFAYLQVHDLARQIAERLPRDDPALTELIEHALRQALRLAEQLEHPHARASSHGAAGDWYLSRGQLERALASTRQALFFSHQTRGGWTTPQWLRLQGQILARQQRLEEALRGYRQAAKQFNTLRHKLADSGYRPPRSFRKQIAPLYYEWADLALRQAALKRGAARQHLLREAQRAMENFKQAELRDYLRSPCFNPPSNCRRLDELLADDSAVLYPIQFPDRLALLLGLPDSLRYLEVPVKAAQLQDTLALFLSSARRHPHPQKRGRRPDAQTTSLEEICLPGNHPRNEPKPELSPTAFQFLPHAQRLYQWLIQPIVADLQAHSIENLIIVPDAGLRTLPFAALHDGEQYLIEHYALGISSGLCLYGEPSSRDHPAQILLAGVSKAVQGFYPIPCVAYELQALRRGHEQARLLLNEDFKLSAFRRALTRQAYSIVHIASHGVFNGEIEESFLLAYDGKLTLDKFEQLNTLRVLNAKPIDLLVLSACETAKGNDRAALGLAGVALKAGARSILASLWKIDDNATPAVIIQFYRQLQNPDMNKIQALRQAQLQLLRMEEYVDYRHPYYWSAFSIIGDWH